MTAVKFSATFKPDSAEFKEWKYIDSVLMASLCRTPEWYSHGYEGIFELCKTKFGVTAYRHENSHVVYSFDSEEDYLIFKLKYGV